MVFAMSAEPPIIDQAQLTGIVCERTQNFAWFLGAGASRSAGLPTATDIIWDLKRRYYCQQENEDIFRQDVHLEAVRSHIQSYMASKGFPTEWAPEEYSTCFEKIVTAQVPPLGHSPRGNFDACGRVCSYPSAFSDPNSLTDPICSGYLGSDKKSSATTRSDSAGISRAFSPRTKPRSPLVSTPE